MYATEVRALAELLIVHARLRGTNEASSRVRVFYADPLLIEWIRRFRAPRPNQEQEP